jgi:hypothetical protein
MSDIIPKAALDYIKNKNLKVGFSYKDVWNEERAASFTVAKAMQLDVLSDMHNAVIQAVEKGQSFDTFKKNIKPILRQKGWWGRKEMEDPLTKKTVNAMQGSDRRLKTIYNVNMRSAYQKEQYDRTMKSDLHPYLMYRTGPSVQHREEHQSYDGLILPKDDPWWDSHFPPRGWGCKCYTRAVTESQLEKYEAEGIPVPPRADGSGGETLRIKTEAPPSGVHYFYNERKGLLEEVPDGVDPAFNWHPGKVARDAGARAALENAQSKYAKATQNIVPTMADRQRTAELQQVSTSFFKKLEKESPTNFKSINTYSEGAGSIINKAIYKTDWEKCPHAVLIRSLDDTISKYPALDAETWFFKGDDASHWSNAVVGKTTTSKGFLSTSALKSRAESYIAENKKALPFMVVIRAPEGTKGLYIGSNTAYNKSGPFKRNEYEYLFPRKADFLVLEKDDAHIVLEAIK